MKPSSIILESKSVLVSSLMCLFGLGGFVVWSSVAPLAEGVIAYGQVSVENERKTIQHLEGGIIQSIHVAEGEVLAPDGQAIAEHFKASGADVEMASYENVTHVFHLHAGWSPTADRAIADVGAWAHRTVWSNEA